MQVMIALLQPNRLQYTPERDDVPDRDDLTQFVVEKVDIKRTLPVTYVFSSFSLPLHFPSPDH
jgi:hypothetical protein